MKSFFLFSFLVLQSDSFSFKRRSLLLGLGGVNSIISESNKKTSSVQQNINDSFLQKDILLGNEEKEAVSGQVGIIQDINNELYFYGPVSQRSCFELKNKLNDLDTKSSIFHIQYQIDPPPIHLHIQSEGGSLYHTLYIMDLIESMKTPVYTYVDGFAASAATLLSVVGKKRYMTQHSLMLIHQLSGSESGKFNELQDQMSNMSILMKIIVEVYLSRSKLNEETLAVLLQKDFGLDSKTCLEYGLVDEII